MGNRTVVQVREGWVEERKHFTAMRCCLNATFGEIILVFHRHILISQKGSLHFYGSETVSPNPFAASCQAVVKR